MKEHSLNISESQQARTTLKVGQKSPKNKALPLRRYKKRPPEEPDSQLSKLREFYGLVYFHKSQQKYLKKSLLYDILNIGDLFRLRNSEEVRGERYDPRRKEKH